jgi:uncharacterized protein (TIGR00297 family)
LDSPIVIISLLVIVAILSWFSVKKKYLTLDGAIIAYIFGLIIIFTGGVILFILLLLAFLITNLATSYNIEEKIRLKLIVAKKPIRDWKNVLANGLPMVLFSIQEYFFSLDLLKLAFIASTASFLSDTVSTEIGVLSKSKPILITNLKESHAGRSGAISKLGLLAGFLSSLVFSMIAYFLIQWNESLLNFVALIVLCSMLANLMDSLIGATLQGNYFCERCNMYSEEPKHTCGSQCKYVSGLKFFNNHVVNFICVLIGGLLAILFSRVIL